MKIYTAEQTFSALPFAKLIAQMRALFAAGVHCPDRHHHSIPLSGEADGSLLLMPGWHDNVGCVKLVNVTPGNSKRNLPAVAASLLIFDRHTGQHLAILDGEAVTARRTAAASALAADYLAPKDAKHLLVIGAGKIAEQLPAAFSAVRPIQHVSVWNRSMAGAQRLVAQLQTQGFAASAVTDLDRILPKADIVSAATLASDPLIHGRYLSSPQHIDLIGSFTPTMREADDETIRRAAGAIVIDTPFTARESGEIAIPLAQGVIQSADIAGDLSALCSGKLSLQADITLFKGAGNAVMDLAAAMTAMQPA
ncbi:MAG: ornithine cyclodeaminase [Gammaproteobacteria bacterium]|nr:MAG: ornithine cyclodeaminase [Gammaproteobacteria bacterium]